MHRLWQDVRYGIRMLLKTPGFTAIAVLSLALGIGANTALFSIVDAMLLKLLPVHEPERLVLFKSLGPRGFSPGSYNGNSTTDPATGERTMTSFAYQSFQRFREQPGLLSDVMAFGSIGLTMSAEGQADAVSAQAVSGNYYSVLGVPAVVGRTLNDADDKPGASPAAVLSYRYWKQRFSGRGDIVGSQVNLNNRAFTVVGVTPAGFEGTGQAGSTQDVTIPLAWEPEIYPDRTRSQMNGAGTWWLRVIGRLKPGATSEAARVQVENVFKNSVIEHRSARQLQSRAEGRNAPNDLEASQFPRLVFEAGGQGEMNTRQYYASSLYMLLGVVALVLLIACANVANLLLSRAASRQKEVGIRLALGASRYRLMQQLLTESVLLSVLGGATGILFALWIKNGLLAVTDWGGRGMRALEPRLDWRVLGFTLLLSLLTGVVFGLAPAWRATRVDLSPTLKDSGRSATAGSKSLLSRGLVVLQVSLSLLLLVGAGLFLRTLFNLQSVDPGFNTNNLLVFGVSPTNIGYRDEKLVQLYEQLSSRLEAIPGVTKVSFSNNTLLSRSASSSSVYLRAAVNTTPDSEGRITPSGNTNIIRGRENFLEAMEIPLLAGRHLSPQDSSTSPKVAVVNQTFVKLFFPNEDSIGKYFTFDPKKPDEIQIVGLARDAKYASPREDVPATAYFSWRQFLNSFGGSTVEVRTTNDPNRVIAAVREAVRQVDPNLPLNYVRTQLETVDQTLSMERLFAKLVTLFGLLAQQLAAIGLFGVLAYSVSQRTREIGIRIALGADRSSVLKMVLRQGMTLAIIGVVCGIGAAWALTRYLEVKLNLKSMLFGVKVNDPWTYASIALLLLVVSFVSCLIPARRATKVDPMVALRYE